jgi:hypothetical protein
MGRGINRCIFPSVPLRHRLRSSSMPSTRKRSLAFRENSDHLRLQYSPSCAPQKGQKDFFVPDLIFPVVATNLELEEAFLARAFAVEIALPSAVGTETVFSPSRRDSTRRGNTRPAACAGRPSSRWPHEPQGDAVANPASPPFRVPVAYDQSGFLIHFDTTPTIPSRNSSTPITKITPWMTVTHAPKVAR